MSELDDIRQPDSIGRFSRTKFSWILVLFRVVGIAAFLFCWVIVMTIAEWGRRVPVDEFDYCIPIRGRGNFYVDPWLGICFYAGSFIAAICILIQVFWQPIAKLAMGRRGS